MAPQYIYTMQQVSMTIDQKQILRDISLCFFPGAKIGVLGNNGAGKSTLLRILAGVEKEFDGEAEPAKGIKIGYVAQEPQLDPEKNVLENVEEGDGSMEPIGSRIRSGNVKNRRSVQSIQHAKHGRWNRRFLHFHLCATGSPGASPPIPRRSQ